MKCKKVELLQLLSQKVVAMDDEEILDVCNKYIEEGFDPSEGIENGLAEGMKEAARLYKEEEYFIPELILCAEVMNMGIDALKKYIVFDKSKKLGKIVIGVIEGDIHDIGKNIVKIMLEASNFEVYDLGNDVAIDDFIQKSKEVRADIIAMSALMTTSMNNMQVLIEELKREKIREDYKVIIGGGPISKEYAQMIGADGYLDSAFEAVDLVKSLINI